MKGEDKDRIESLTKALGDVSGKMAERVYAQGQGGAGAQATGAGGGAESTADDVVDAEFEEVKDDKK
jgi:molecular chaperone DnaK